MEKIANYVAPVQYTNAFKFFKQNYLETCGPFGPNASVKIENDTLYFDEGDGYDPNPYIFHLENGKFILDGRIKLA